MKLNKISLQIKYNELNKISLQIKYNEDITKDFLAIELFSASWIPGFGYIGYLGNYHERLTYTIELNQL